MIHIIVLYCYRKIVIYERYKNMGRLSAFVKFESGSPQFRIKQSTDTKAPVYTYYSQTDLFDDLSGIISNDDLIKKQIKTNDSVCILAESDLVFSLISGTAAIVRKTHEGYLYTQNYVKMTSVKNIDSKFLVYLINENRFIKKQLLSGLQGSQVFKYTLSQLKELRLPQIPSIDKQKIIGEVYFKQLRLKVLKNRVAELESKLILDKLKKGMM